MYNYYFCICICKKRERGRESRKSIAYSKQHLHFTYKHQRAKNTKKIHHRQTGTHIHNYITHTIVHPQERKYFANVLKFCAI